MRLSALVLALTLATSSVGVTGCASAPILQGQTAVTVAKGEYALEEAYNVAAHAYLDAPDTGAWAARKAQAKPILVKLYAAVKAARSAQALGNATDLASQTQLAGQLYGQVMSILKPEGN